MQRKLTILAIGLVAVVALMVVYTAGWLKGKTGQGTALVKEAQAAGGMVKGPNEVAPDRYVCYPGTELPAKDEVRVIACGTGMPDQRRGQASASLFIPVPGLSQTRLHPFIRHTAVIYIRPLCSRLSFQQKTAGRAASNRIRAVQFSKPKIQTDAGRGNQDLVRKKI